MKTTLKILLLLSVLFPLISSAQPAIQWKHCYGGSRGDDPKTIFQTTDGGYIVAGESISKDLQVQGNHGLDDIWIIKLKSDGALEWEKSIGGSKTDYLSSCIQTSDNGFILVGSTSSKNGDITDRNTASDSTDLLICKLSETGNIQWIKTYGGSGEELGSEIIEASDGGYVITGDTAGYTFSRNGWIFKVDSVGSVLWSTVLPKAWVTSIVETYGGYMVTGLTSFNDSSHYKLHGASDLWVAKLTSNGVIEWQMVYGGSNADGGGIIRRIRVAESDNFIIAGGTNSNDGDVTNFHPSPNGWDDIWVIKIDGSGKLLWQRTLGGSQSDVASSIIATKDNKLLLMASTSSSDGDVSGHHGDEWLFSPWIIKMDIDGTIEWEHSYNILMDQAGHGDNYGSMIIPTADNGYIFTAGVNTSGGDVSGHHGYTDKDYWVVKLAPEVSGVSSPSVVEENISISPNPTTGIGKINYTLNEPASVRFEVYNILGQRIEVVGDTYEQSGMHSLPFDLSGRSNGTYFLRSQINSVLRTVPFEISR
jgi:hypothetical protein